jgi:transposase InsO family protein
VKFLRFTPPYIPTGEGCLYLAGIKEIFTCEIVGYALGERMTKELVGKALFQAVTTKRPPPGLIHHSDRGSIAVTTNRRQSCFKRQAQSEGVKHRLDRCVQCGSPAIV